MKSNLPILLASTALSLSAAQAVTLTFNLAPGGNTGSNGNLNNNPVNGSTFGTDATIFNVGNIDTLITQGLGTASTGGSFSLDDGLGNSGNYNLSFVLTGTTANGTAGTVIEQGGTGAKGLLTASEDSTGGLNGTSVTDGAETLSITSITLTPDGAIIGNPFTFDGFNGVFLGVSNGADDAGTINGDALTTAVGATGNAGNSGNTQDSALGFQSFALSDSFVLTSTGGAVTLTGFQADFSAVPEPSSVALLGLSAAGLVLRRRRQS